MQVYFYLLKEFVERDFFFKCIRDFQNWAAFCILLKAYKSDDNTQVFKKKLNIFLATNGNYRKCDLNSFTFFRIIILIFALTFFKQCSFIT